MILISGLTTKQVAILETAKAFLAKGEALQYDSIYLCTGKNAAGTTLNRNTRRNMHLSPEEATMQDNRYTVCSGFTYSVYEEALGIQIPVYTIDLMEEVFNNKDNKTYVPILEKTSDNPDLQEFRDALQIGDVIVYRAGAEEDADIAPDATNAELYGTSGHAMLYIGNGQIMHSSGTHYDSTTREDKKEDNGTIRIDNVYKMLLTPDSSEYLLRKDAEGEYIRSYYAILRPLETEAGKNAEITNSAKTRMKYNGLVTELKSSTITKQSVNLGETITYKVMVTNNGETTYTNLPVEIQIPEYTTYKENSVSHNGILNQNKIKWEIKTLFPNQTVELSFCIKVNNVADNMRKEIIAQASIECIKSNIIKNQIGANLTKEEQKAIIATVNQYYIKGQQGFVEGTSGSIPMENITLPPEEAGEGKKIKFNVGNFMTAIYREAFGVNLAMTSTTTVADSIFQTAGTLGVTPVYNLISAETGNNIRKMLVSDLYGGRKVFTDDLTPRAKIIEEYYLQVGDIILVRSDSEETETGTFYMYIGENQLVTINTEARS